MTSVTVPELAAWIREKDKFALVAHISPDGDAIGSALLLNCALDQLGKESYVVCQDEVPAMYAFLPGFLSIKKTQCTPFPPENVIFIDISSPDRAGDAWAYIDVAKESATIDHHGTNAGFTDLLLLDEKASATGELIGLLIRELSLTLDKPMATLLYTSLSTDTGNFSYSCTTPLAFRLAAECVEAGLEIDEINMLLFRRRTRARTLLMGRSLSNMDFFEEDKVAVTNILREDFDACSGCHEDAEGIINFLIEIEGVCVSALFEERVTTTKVSLRSNGLVHVGQIALAMGGGGHECASGVELNMPVHAARALVLSAISEQVRSVIH